MLDKAWWLLEVVPTENAWQDGRGVWHRKWGLHLGRGRRIPDTGDPVMVHESVKRRVESALGYKPRAVWKGAEVGGSRRALANIARTCHRARRLLSGEGSSSSGLGPQTCA